MDHYALLGETHVKLDSVTWARLLLVVFLVFVHSVAFIYNAECLLEEGVGSVRCVQVGHFEKPWVAQGNIFGQLSGVFVFHNFIFPFIGLLAGELVLVLDHAVDQLIHGLFRGAPSLLVHSGGNQREGVLGAGQFCIFLVISGSDANSIRIELKDSMELKVGSFGGEDLSELPVWPDLELAVANEVEDADLVELG